MMSYTSAAAERPAVTIYTADVSICSQICRLAVVEHGIQPENVNVDIECAMENYEVRVSHTCLRPLVGSGGHIVFLISRPASDMVPTYLPLPTGSADAARHRT